MIRDCVCTTSPGGVCFLGGEGCGLWCEEAERPCRELGEGTRLPHFPLTPLTDHLSLLPAAPASPRTFSLLLTWTFSWPSSLHPRLTLLGQGLFKDPLKLEPLFGPEGPSFQHLMGVSQHLIGMAISWMFLSSNKP